jgi:hypothetical protein
MRCCSYGEKCKKDGDKMNKLKKGETILATRFAASSGPGWSNRLVWVYIRDSDGNIREDAIQPEEQTELMAQMFRAVAHVDSTMIKEIAWKWGDQ